MSKVVARARSHTAGPTNHSDTFWISGLEPLSRAFRTTTDHSDHALARTQHAKRVGSKKNRAIRFRRRRDLHGVPHGHAIGHQHREFDARFNRGNGRVLHGRRRYKKYGDVDLANSFHRVLRRVEHGHAQHGLPAFARRHPRDHIGSVLAHQTRARLTFAAGDALHQNALGLVDQNCHYLVRASNQLLQSGNIKFKIEAFDSSESTFDIAREQLGIFIGEFFVR